MTTRPTPPMPVRGRYTMTRLRPTGTCTAPTHATEAELEYLETGDDRMWPYSNACRLFTRCRCPAPAPLTCEGTDWPPMTSWQRYAEDRRLGQRVPPSVSTWRPEDVRRQQDADAQARGLAPKPTVAVAWGPSCEGKAGR